MKAQHTQGPWAIAQCPRENVVDGFVTVITDSRGHGLVTFCQMGKSSKVRANARLIAASPDLLEACEAIAALADGQGQANLVMVAGQARAAIAAAKGEA